MSAPEPSRAPAALPLPVRPVPGQADPYAQRRVALHRAILDRTLAELASGRSPKRARILRSLAKVTAAQLPCFNLRLVRGGVA